MNAEDDNFLDSVVSKCIAGDWNEVAAFVADVDQQNPNYPTACVARAINCLRQRDPRAAIRQLELAGAADRAKTLQAYGRISMAVYPPIGEYDAPFAADLLKGEPEDVLIATNEKIGQRPLDVANYLRRAEVVDCVYFVQDTPEQSEATLEWLDAGLGDATIALLEPTLAEAAYRIRSSLWSLRRDAVNDLRDGNDAAEDLGQANRLAGRSAENMDSYARLLCDAKRFHESLQVIAAYGDDGFRPNWLMIRGRCHFELKEYAKAIADFDDAIKSYQSLPNSPPSSIAFALYQRGTCHFELGDYRSAIRDARASQCLETKNLSIFQYPLIYQAMLRQGDIKLVSEIIDKPADMVSDPQTALYERGKYFLESDRFAEAEKDFLALATPDSGSHAPEQYLVTIYQKQGKADLAEKYAKLVAEKIAKLPYWMR
ncbi:hypothetical protein DSM3645_27608 [Blastopirellula marina DSM 3645]|uniref:Tetratricopeptide repeat protein n=2 Tax=Blastopirellula marina TaxID=124 RepID=A3ZX43_9BACT|nr:hypothetical protein DSM3645_27608 [Blastopirellula marina DSM 3645]